MAIKVKIVIEGTGGVELKKVFDKIKTLKPDGRYRVFVLDAKLLRSSKINRYYWFCLGVISDHTGIDSEDIHELCKKMFNLQTIILGNEMIEISGSTKLLKNDKMARYIDKIRQWSLDNLNCRIPEANEMSDEDIIELINKNI